MNTRTHRILPIALALLVCLAGCLPGGGSGDVDDSGTQFDAGGDAAGFDASGDGGGTGGDAATGSDADEPDASAPDSGPTCTNQQRVCDDQCATCPSGDGIAATGCESARCVITACEQGYRRCDAGCCEYTPPGSGSVADVGYAVAYGAFHLDVDSDGYPHLLFTADERPDSPFHAGQGEPFYARWDGGAWQTGGLNADFEYDTISSAQLLLDESDQPHIAVADYGIGYYITGGIGNWTIDVLNTTGNEVGSSPSMAFRDGEMCIAFTGSVDYKRVFCGSAGNFDDQRFYSGDPGGMDIAFDTTGQLHMAVPNDSAPALMWSRNGNSWDNNFLLDPESDGFYEQGLFNRLEPLPQRQLVVAYFAEGIPYDDGIQVATLSVDGDDTSYSVIDETRFEAPVGEARFDLATNGDGKIALVYNKTGSNEGRDQLPGEVWLAIREGGNWSNEQIGTGGRAVSVVIGPFGNVHAAHVDGDKRIQYVIR